MKVIIIGGGYAGTTLAEELDKRFDVTLIEKRERFFHNSGSLRAAVNARWLKKLFIPYDHLLKRGRVVNGTVVEANPEEVVLEDGQRLKFDYLVLATGSSYPFPAKMASDKVAEAETAVRLVNERIEQAKSILLIGAGPVGIELAGEIASLYPGKPVTLIDPIDRLMPTFNPKLGERLYKGLQSLGVRVLLEEKLVKMPAATNVNSPEQPPLQTYLTEKGTQIEADIHFICFGIQLNTQYLHLGSIVDEQKQVKVNDHLQVQGYENIFAIGDVVNTGEAKLITTAEAHAKIVAFNIERLAANNHTLLVHHPKNTAIVIVPLGAKGGAVQLPLGKNGIILGAWAASQIKGKSLRAEQRWKALGAVPNDKL
ncbi:MAG: FAD-dependent oxidoreductase [Anaerolineales bacterium]